MTHFDETGGFRESLEHLETCLQTPIVSGELASWLCDAHQALQAVVATLRSDAQPRHEAMFSKMSPEGSELLSRVDQLRRAERELLRTADCLTQRLTALCEQAKAVEPDEGKLERPVEEFIDEGLAFVLAARKQDTSVITWYLQRSTM